MTPYNTLVVVIESLTVIMLLVSIFIPTVGTLVPLYRRTHRISWPQLSRLGFRILVGIFITRAALVRYLLNPTEPHIGQDWPIWISLFAITLIILTWTSHPDHFQGT